MPTSTEVKNVCTYRSPPGIAVFFLYSTSFCHIFCLYSHRVVIFVGVMRSSFSERIFYYRKKAMAAVTGSAAAPAGASVRRFSQNSDEMGYNSVDADEENMDRGQFIEVRGVCKLI